MDFASPTGSFRSLRTPRALLRTPSRAAPATVVLALFPALLHGQIVRGTVVEAGSRQPVPNAIVLLLDASGERHDAELTDAQGAYAVAARGPGTYTLRVERVGYRATTGAAVQLAEGETAIRDLTAGAGRVVMPALVARGEARRCGGALRNGGQAATLWDEARKAVLSSWLATEGGQYVFTTEIRERETSPDGRRVRRESTRQQRTRGLPFRSAPAEALVSGGYVVQTPDEIAVQGVDAAAILSDAFLEHHCFGMRDGGAERPGLVGLEFVPLAGVTKPDVRGTLWIDRATSELRYVEYGYTGLRFRGRMDGVRGRLDFRRMPDGLWTVERWLLAVPVLLRERAAEALGGMERYRVIGLLERSGHVIGVQHTGRVIAHAGVR